jgi:hypothetical protein
MRRAVLLMFLLLCVACTSERSGTSSVPSPSGPDSVDLEVVAKHATQFDDELPDRAPGSQEEFAAATYILGTLQQAGYVVRLESVPLDGLEKSTTVFAVTAGGEAPEFIVTVPYSSSLDGPSGEAIGLLLEMARALRVLVPDHNVAFAALGAEVPGPGGGAGSRSLARFLTAEELEPVVIRLQSVSGDRPGSFKSFGGDLADELNARLCEGEMACDSTQEAVVFRPDPVAQEGFEHLLVIGSSDGISEVLLPYLAEHGR